MSRFRVGRVADEWLARLWMAFVVMVTAAIWFRGPRLNPARVTDLMVVAPVWIWTLLWWRVHNAVPLLAARWFGPRFVVVALFCLSIPWSLGVPGFRDDALATAWSPDGTRRLVLTGVAGDRYYDLQAETHGGLLLKRVVQLEIYFVTSRTIGQVTHVDEPIYPTRFAIEWRANPRQVVVTADGCYAALFDVVEERLVERRWLNMRHDAIADALSASGLPARR